MFLGCTVVSTVTCARSRGRMPYFHRPLAASRSAASDHPLLRRQPDKEAPERRGDILERRGPLGTASAAG